MTKFNYFFYFVLASILLYSCSDSGDDIRRRKPFDHESKAKKDNDTIIKFLKTHYYKDDVDSIKPLKTGKTSLFSDSRLKSKVINEYDLDYTYYYFVKENGISKKGFPTIVDSVLTTYRLSSLVISNKLEKEEDSEVPAWYNAANVLRGWVHGFTHFKGGLLKTTNDDGSPINGPNIYKATGKGFFLLPSGLSYRNTRGRKLANKNLLYIVDLHDIIQDTDHDLDNVPSILEDVNGDGKPWNDDSDGDRVANFLDSDDDGDGTLTKNEVDEEGGNPLNNFSDPDNPDTPDFLNRDIYK